ncbi:hypothetical protein VSR01_00130 [Actinacidiphila sp. DG2A-62]|uniref:hypothetical protein n=1 Tax=Actinacidiphila sp. DG2A-62 TaxID=3108821 RepID=UPI002DB988A1|nr:hypothetical protein [Actinacidiphila sp. DG2A-62]MEC3992036.1 hypothetical protein [Actinacidiphila sp. DG2A-62]
MDTSQTEPAALVKAAVEQALALRDPSERARAITGILGVVKEANPELKAAREADVRTLRETLTLREVGERTGMSTARVDQIAKGRVTGRRVGKDAASTDQ